MDYKEIVEELLELISNKKIREIKEKLSKMDEIDVAEVMNELPIDNSLLVIFRLLDKNISSEVFANLDTDNQEYIISRITDKEISLIIEELFTDDAVDMLEEMPANVVARVLRNATAETRKMINQFLQYPASSAGSVMTSEYLGLKANMTIPEAVNYIRKNAEGTETIYTCYVTGATRILEGVVSIKDILLADKDAKIKDIMTTDFQFAHTMDDQENIAQDFAKYDLLSLPVLDNENRLVGIITIDDIVDVIQEESTEDFMRISAVAPTKDEYLKTNVLSIAKSRIVWLLVLMISAIFSGLILENFKDAIAAIPILIVFIPMIMDTGGNAGSQASITIIRGMALNEITLKDILKVVWKEIRVALLCGIVLCIFCTLRVLIQYHDIDGGTYKLVLVLTGTMMATVVVAKLVGATLPMLAKAIKLDPAIMAAPLITTMVDVVALGIFFLLSKLVYGI